MDIKKYINIIWIKICTIVPLLIDSIKELSTWIFASFLLPLVQLFVINFSKEPSGTIEDIYNIIFVTIASFLTSVFFVTNFWKQNRTIVRMMLVLSYLISFGLFLVSLINSSFFESEVYKWGMYIALAFAVLVGFYSKYDEKSAIAREIVGNAKKKTHGTLNNKDFKV